jgi:hypothetical protein
MSANVIESLKNRKKLHIIDLKQLKGSQKFKYLFKLKSIGGNFKIDTILFFKCLFKIKNSNDLKIITNRIKLKFCTRKYLQILIPSKN